MVMIIISYISARYGGGNSCHNLSQDRSINLILPVLSTPSLLGLDMISSAMVLLAVVRLPGEKNFLYSCIFRWLLCSTLRFILPSLFLISYIPTLFLLRHPVFPRFPPLAHSYILFSFMNDFIKWHSQNFLRKGQIWSYRVGIWSLVGNPPFPIGLN